MNFFHYHFHDNTGNLSDEVIKENDNVNELSLIVNNNHSNMVSIFATLNDNINHPPDFNNIIYNTLIDDVYHLNT